MEDPENVCPDWQKATGQKIVCQKVGHEVVDGRQTVKYQNKSTSAGDSTSAVWIDLTLNFPVKWENPNISAELRNIKVGPQSAELFATPDDYGVLRPGKNQLRMAGRTK